MNKHQIDPHALVAACKAVEDTLIDFRDSRISMMGCPHGFVVREKDGASSDVIRLDTFHGLTIAIEAYLTYLSTNR